MIVSPDPADPITPNQRALLAAAWPDGARLTTAFDLADNLHTLDALLYGFPVDVDNLARDGYRKARQKRLITLTRPADLFNVGTAA